MLIYKATLDFRSEYDLKYLVEITKIRHDLVHRNGKDNDRNRVELDMASLSSCISEIEKFVAYLDQKLNQHHAR